MFDPAHVLQISYESMMASLRVSNPGIVETWNLVGQRTKFDTALAWTAFL